MTAAQKEQKILVEVNNLVKYFPVRAGFLQRVVAQVQAVDNVSFFVREGETLGLVGESGCGKSVTALTIMRLIPDPPGKILGGKIELEGTDLLRLSPAAMRYIVEQGFDCAVRVGDLPDSSLVSVRLADNRRLCVAAPEYLQRAGVPA